MHQHDDANKALEMECSVLKQHVADQQRHKSNKTTNPRFLTLAHRVPDGILFTNGDYVITYANRAAGTILGYDEPNDLIGRSLFTCTASPREHVMDIYSHVTHHGEWRGVLACQRRDSSVFLGQVVAFALLDSSDDSGYGQIGGIGCIIRASSQPDAHHLPPEPDVQDEAVCGCDTREEIPECKQMETALRQSQSLFYTYMLHSPTLMFARDMQGRFLFTNPAYEAMTRCSAEAMLGQTPYEVLPQTVAEEFLQHDREIIATGHSTTRENLVPLPDGDHYYLASKFPLYDADGNLYAVGGISTDITLHKRTEQALRRQVQTLTTLRVMMNELAGNLHLDRLLHAIVERAVALLDATDGQLSMYDPQHNDLVNCICYHMGRDYTGLRCPMGVGATGQVALTREPLVIGNYMTWNGRLPSYEVFGAKSVVLVPLLAGDELFGVLGIGSTSRSHVFDQADVELLGLFAQQAAIAIQNARLFAEVEQLATTDPLTGLHNRRQFFALACREFARVQRYQQPLAVIMLDIDNFKHVNDSCGHTAGDQVLKAVAGLCRTVLRTVDIIGRYGGEEIVVVLPDTHLHGVQQVAERLRRSLEQTVIPTDSKPVQVTASMGVAVYDPTHPDTADVPDLETVIDRADEALRVAKRTGKNRVVPWKAGMRLSDTDMPRQVLRQSHRHAEALVRVAAQLNSHLDLDTVIQAICDETTATLQVPYAVIQLYDPQHDCLNFAAVTGFPAAYLQEAVPTPRADYEALLQQRGPVVVVPDLQQFTDGPNTRLHQKLNLRTFVSVPIWHAGHLVGALTTGTRGSQRTITTEECAFLQGMADQAAVAITNARLFAELIHAHDAALVGWSQAIELRNCEPSGHTGYVAEWMMRMLPGLDVEQRAYEHIRRGVLLHDIGCMHIPDTVLRKPGALTADEWRLIRQHPVFAYEMLSPIDFLRPALDIPCYHHERWDGSGYPYGLKGEQIPLTARLFSVVDVWHALCSERPYRAAWPQSRARAYLEEQTGKQFDPLMVTTFLRLMDAD